MVLYDHAHIVPAAANFTEATRQYPMPEKGHLLEQRTLSPRHAQQPPALLIESQIEVDIQSLKTILQGIIRHLLVVEEAVHSTIEAKVLIHC